MAFSFGGQKTGFGTATTSTGFGFGGLGTTTTNSTSGGLLNLSAVPTTTSTGFGTTTFGAAAAGGAGGGLLGGGTQTGAFGTATGTGFGGTQTTGFGTGTAGFGGTTGFGATTSAGFASTGFGGGTATTAFGGLNTGFGAPSAATGFGTGAGFGTGTGLGAGLGAGLGTGLGAGLGTGLGAGLGTGVNTGLNLQAAQQQQQPQVGAAQTVSTMARAVSLPTIYGDERDAIIAKWNQLQAFWGTGRGYYNMQAEFVNFMAENPFCRFKAVGYSCIPTTRNEDGLVGFIFNKRVGDVKNNQQQIVDILQRAIASGNAALSVCVEDVKALPGDKTEMILYIQERAPTGTTRRIPATTVYKAISGNAQIKNVLTSQLTVENALPKINLNKDQLKQYLDSPPAGIDGRIWQQAKLDNPDPERFIPVPMIGFTELHNRLTQQEQQTGLHQKRIDIIASDIATLQRNHGNMLSKIEEYKRRYLELSHRVLQVMVKQEIYRKTGFVIQADEEQLRTQLETIQAELNAPTRFKGRLNELMSQLRMQNQLGGVKCEASYNMDGSVQQEIRQHLKQQQEGIQHLISIIREDTEDLTLIDDGLINSGKHHR